MVILRILRLAESLSILRAEGQLSSSTKPAHEAGFLTRRDRCRRVPHSPPCAMVLHLRYLRGSGGGLHTWWSEFSEGIQGTVAVYRSNYWNSLA